MSTLKARTQSLIAQNHDHHDAPPVIGHSSNGQGQARIPEHIAIETLRDMKGRRARFMTVIGERIEPREANILDWYRELDHPEWGTWFLVQMVGFARPVMMEADSFVSFVGVGIG